MTPNPAARLVALLAILGVVLAGCSGTTATIELIDAQEAYELTQDPPAELVVLDIRTPEEYAAGHLEDSIMIDFYGPDFSDRLDTLDKDVPYLVYCRSGNRSEQAIDIMRDLGFEEVYEMDGGIVDWAELGFPLTAA